MPILLILNIATAFLVQTSSRTHGVAQTTPSPSPETASASVLVEIEGLTNDVFNLLGTCETWLPPSFIQLITYPFYLEALADATEDQRARIASIASAYAGGKSSPRAITITQTECAAELDTLSATMTAKAKELGQ